MRAPSLLAVIVALLAGWMLLATSAAAEGPHDAEDLAPGWVLYDGGALLSPGDYPSNSMPLELALDYFAAGTPLVKWDTSTVPTVTMCTRQNGRPSWVTAEQFREAVRLGVAAWSEAEARVGFDYTGDCSGSGSWQFNNGINEIGWDDSRNLVRNPAAAVTQGSWTNGFAARPFAETDIVFHESLNVPAACLRSTMAHELGHALGLGHSNAFGDLMYPSFNSSDVSTCPAGPTAAERAVVQDLYGVNRKPMFNSQAQQQTAPAGSRVTLTAPASDPEGDTLSYTWTQTGGTPVTMSPAGSAMTFTAPKQQGATLTFEVQVRDRYRHAASTSLSVLVQAATNPPKGTPSLASILPGAGGRMTLGWEVASPASEYEFCFTSTGTSQATCVRQLEPTVQVTWDTVLGAAVENEPRRVFTTGTRETSMRACNEQGCSSVGVGPHAGGLRWTAHDVDYDYFAMSFDVPGTSLRFTIIGVVNVDGPARRFSLYSGSSSDFEAKRVLNCGNVLAGQMCMGLLTPNDRGHGQFATVISERTGTPVLEHRVRIR